jgi:hypothetical protein
MMKVFFMRMIAVENCGTTKTLTLFLTRSASYMVADYFSADFGWLQNRDGGPGA